MQSSMIRFWQIGQVSTRRSHDDNAMDFQFFISKRFGPLQLPFPSPRGGISKPTASDIPLASQSSLLSSSPAPGISKALAKFTCHGILAASQISFRPSSPALAYPAIPPVSQTFFLPSRLAPSSTSKPAPKPTRKAPKQQKTQGRSGTKKWIFLEQLSHFRPSPQQA